VPRRQQDRRKLSAFQPQRKRYFGQFLFLPFNKYFWADAFIYLFQPGFEPGSSVPEVDAMSFGIFIDLLATTSKCNSTWLLVVFITFCCSCINPNCSFSSFHRAKIHVAIEPDPGAGAGYPGVQGSGSP
jgi:hypothetical protein